jgi:hypothetical protein
MFLILILIMLVEFVFFFACWVFEINPFIPILTLTGVLGISATVFFLFLHRIEKKPCAIYHSIPKEITSLGKTIMGVCPLCGKSIKKVNRKWVALDNENIYSSFQNRRK